MDIKNESWANGTVSTREFLGEQLKSLKELTDVRFKASETAVNAALHTSEKAIRKSETIQNDINKAINELTKDVISLRESRSQGSGKEAATVTDKQQSNFNMSLAISIGFNILMLLAVIWKALGK